eukprot:TRINITY_DN334_c1_g3_i1.p1 TRINITY_DN334_c1_g3~~TRINITY_DN334_c1_g3_i1.p1  ORF type:complete len:416 (-),score=132.62 TRINITY_DN334_c1_g3_i1:345-1592(-)
MDLIINADDFGYEPERDDGIIDGFTKGVITSTSVLVNRRNAKLAIEKLQKLKIDLPMGLHFNLTEGSALTDDRPFPGKHEFWELALSSFSSLSASSTPSLLSSSSTSSSSSSSSNLTNISQSVLSLDGVEKELVAQIHMFQKLTGRLPTHIDGHNHIHVAPGVCEVVAKVMKMYKITKTRIPIETVSLETMLNPSSTASNSPASIASSSSHAVVSSSSCSSSSSSLSCVSSSSSSSFSSSPSSSTTFVSASESLSSSITSSSSSSTTCTSKTNINLSCAVVSLSVVKKQHTFLQRMQDFALKAKTVFQNMGIRFSHYFIGLNWSNSPLSVDTVASTLSTIAKTVINDKKLVSNNNDKSLHRVVVEYMAHPGYVSKEGDDFSRSSNRAGELAVLMNPSLRSSIQHLGYRLISVRDL